MRILSLLAAALALSACTQERVQTAPPAAAELREPVTILVSIDGFRPDYLERGVTPNLLRLAAEGASGPMRPSFPSKTFPNHWTIVTGLRPDRHGITANRMEDPARPGETFTMASDDPFWWNAATPIWVDAEKAGIATATLFWPGSNINIGGVKGKWPDDFVGGTRPRDWQQYNGEVTARQRVDGVIDWLRRPASSRPRLLTLYFESVDDAGHAYGPGDDRTTRAIAEIDAVIGRLAAELDRLGQPANLIILADHGMAATSSARVIALDSLLSAGSGRSVETGPYATLVPAPGQEAAVEKRLLGRHPHMECWRKGEIPGRFHYGSNVRIPPILCLADIGWEIADKPPSERRSGGNHGYDNLAPEMRALFIAHGPAFRAAKLDAFDNVDVYPLLRRLIGLPAKADMDGSDAVFRDALVR